LGFYISSLRVTGDKKKDAEITFKDGFNLVSGVSDTGKSYIFGCLNYLLGKSDSPKVIPEAIGYINFYLSIKTYNGESYTFFRKLNSKSILIKECDIKEYDNTTIKFEEYHINTKKEKNISTFLLKLNGIEDKCLRKSKSSKVNLLYSYIRKLTFISETSIVSELSPFYPTFQFSDRPLYQSLLFYLVTGNDFSSYIPIEKEDIRKSRLNGQKEFIRKRIKNILINIDEISYLQKPFLGNSINHDLNVLEEEALNINKTIRDLSRERSEIFTETEKYKSSVLFINELIERMELLKSHYVSDLSRLGFIDEGQQLLNQLKTVNCPLCDANIQSEKLKGIEVNITVKDSINSEREKICLKLIDLDSTINENKKELIKLDGLLKFNDLCFEQINKDIFDVLKPKFDIIIEKISNIKDYYTYKSKLEVFNTELNLYTTELDKIDSLLKIKPISQSPENIDEGLMKTFLSTFKMLLKAWNYPNNEVVKFDSNSEIFDFVLTSKARSSFGKGMRAISYTAVIYSLVQYCIDNSIPFTKNLIIDSPLTTYHGKEKKTKDHEIDGNIEHCFFKYFAEKSIDFQFIMFDNKEPKNEIINDINYIEFTGEIGSGRFGFFPMETNLFN